MGRFASLLSHEPLPAEEQRHLGRLIKDLRGSEDPRDVAAVRLAVNTLVLSSVRFLAWLATRYTDGPVSCSLDELVSEGYSRLLLFGDGYDVDRASFCGWAGYILKHQFRKMAGFTAAGARRAFLECSLDDESDQWGDLASVAVYRDPEPAEVPEGLSRGLTDTERRVLDLTYIQGLTPSEASRALETSRQNIDQIHRKAIGKMRRAAGVEVPAGPDDEKRLEARKKHRRERVNRWLWGRQVAVLP